MDMHTTVLLVRTLMLVGIVSPLVVGGIVLAIRHRYRVSKASGGAPTSPGREPRLVSRSHWDVTHREAVGANDSEASASRTERRAA